MPQSTSQAELALILVAKGLIQLHTQIQSGNHLKFPYPHKLQRGYDKLTHLYLQQGDSPPTSIVELINWCATKPLAHWTLELPEDAVNEDDLLLEDEEPTEVCYEWSELEDSDEGKLQREIIIEVMKIARKEKKPSLYKEFRRMLIEKPIVDFFGIKRAKTSMAALSTQLGQAYQEIPEQYVVEEVIHQCNRCGYMMIPTTNQDFVCGNSLCQKKYKPKSKTVRGHNPFYLVQDDIHRFITLPGNPELRLEQALQKLDHLQVEIWAEYDTHDLYLTFPDGEKWAADVKDWRDPYKLAKKVESRSFPDLPEWERGFYVFPDERHRQREDYKRAFLKHFTQSEIEVMWESEFLQEVKKKLKGIYA